MPRPKKTVPKGAAPRTKSYAHPEAKSLLRPDVGTQALFRKQKGPAICRYDSSLSPALDWDGANGAREVGEWLLARLAKAADLPSPQQIDRPREMKDASGRVAASVSSASPSNRTRGSSWRRATRRSASLWEHLAGTASAPFEAGEHAQAAVKVIDDRGNELRVVKRLEERR